ncbi:heparin-binding hemagglutinin [Nocardia sp. alder85J]|uniref:heparin-binding hemagglutinin n=1 Tax=Nocardia sp. alder85J TaxID=2862949 RepID=UPI001CD27402|nr:heparin-binding hemagglutinin [Nocardia sp. alder85J]MCX4098820.1 heparin-binding hemagglutinin [Nocardia sp. alder85J]
MTETTTPTVTKSIYATVGAGDALYTAVTEVVDKVRERATGTDVGGRVEEARERLSTLPADVQEQFESLRQRLTELSSDLPEEIADLRDKLSSAESRSKLTAELGDRFGPDELRKLVDQYYHQFLGFYSELAERGEVTVGRLRSTPGVEERIGRVEGVYNDVVSRAEGVLGKVSGQVGGLLGGKAAPAGSEAEAPTIVDAEVVDVSIETEMLAEQAAAEQVLAEEVAAEQAAAEQATAKKAPAKKAAPKKPAAEQ